MGHLCITLSKTQELEKVDMGVECPLLGMTNQLPSQQLWGVTAAVGV